jgi:hypothetical protein
MGATIGTASTRRQRHESASGRVSAVAAVLDAFDAHVAELPPDSVGAADVEGLRRVVRAVLPLALADPTFDVTSTLGGTGVSVRVHHDAEHGLTARIVPGAAAHDKQRDPTRVAAEPAGSQVVGELAELLRGRQVRRP